jgi:shikimate dehydrogenase
MTQRPYLLGLIGGNILNTLAPTLQEDALRALGLRGHYHLMDLDVAPKRRLEDVFAAVKCVGFAGVNVTFPVKQAVMPLLDAISDEARQIGAVNIVTFSEDGRATGHNTDRSGFRRSLEVAYGANGLEGQTVALVGAGGAGRACAFALMDLGAARVDVHDVDQARARSLVADLAKYFGAARCRLSDNLEATIRGAQGIVNASPIGMVGVPGNPVPEPYLAPAQWVADAIYTPLETQLIQAARAKGCRVFTGDGMNVHQAVDSFRCFTGREADFERMKRTFDTAMAARIASAKGKS